MAEIGAGDTSWIPQRYHLDTSSPWIPNLDNSNCHHTFLAQIALLTKVTQEVDVINIHHSLCLMQFEFNKQSRNLPLQKEGNDHCGRYREQI